MNFSRRTKEFVRGHVPGLSKCLDFIYGGQFRGRSLSEVFDHIYQSNAFGSQESVSGPGSEHGETHQVVAELPDVVRRLGVRAVLDAPCGDYGWMWRIRNSFDDYTGADIVQALVDKNQEKYGDARTRFVRADISCDSLPKVDMVICRDCLVHLPFGVAFKAIENFRKSGSTYLLATSYLETTKNIDIVAGLWRPLNLCRSPFNFPVPLIAINERSEVMNRQYADKHLCLWRIAELPILVKFRRSCNSFGCTPVD